MKVKVKTAHKPEVKGRRELPKLQPLRPRITEEAIRRRGRGVSFMAALRELIKNSIDAGATYINVVTTDKSRLVVIDNGCGVDEKRRRQLMNYGHETGDIVEGSGEHGTGFKKAKDAAWVKSFMIRTAPKHEKEQDLVVEWGYSSDDHIHAASERLEKPIVPIWKDKENWPYDFEYGTVMTLVYADPKSPVLKRGAVLRDILAYNLTDFLHQVVFVDGEALPDKSIEGDRYSRIFTEKDHEVFVEPAKVFLFRPTDPDKARKLEAGLTVGSNEVGDISIGELFKAVVGTLGFDFPKHLTSDKVFGTITWKGYKKYLNEDRSTVNPLVASEPGTIILLKLIAKESDIIAKRLKLDNQPTAVVDDWSELSSCIAVFNSTYQKNGDEPPVTTEADDDEQKTESKTETDEDDDDVTETSSEDGFLLKSSRREVQVGEELTIRVRFFGTYRQKYTIKDLVWFDTRSRCKDFRVHDTYVTLVAERPGAGYISARLKDKDYSATASYQVVAERMFKLANQVSTAKVGEDLLIMTVNSDKILGDLLCKIQPGGIGAVKVKGRTLVFRSDVLGSADVTAYDSKDRFRTDTCKVTVVPKEVPALKLQDRHFRVSLMNIFPGAGDRPVVMWGAAGDRYQNIVFQKNSVLYQQALRERRMLEMLVPAVAHEYGRFLHFELEPEEEVSIQKTSVYQANTAYKVMQEVFAQLHRKKK